MEEHDDLKLEPDDDSTDVTGVPTTTLTASDEKDSKDYNAKLQVKAKGVNHAEINLFKTTGRTASN